MMGSAPSTVTSCIVVAPALTSRRLPPAFAPILSMNCVRRTNKFEIGQGQFLISTLSLGDRVGVFEILETKALDRERIGSDAGDLFVNVLN